MSLLLKIIQMLGTLISRLSSVSVKVDGLVLGQNRLLVESVATQRAIQSLDSKLDQIIGLLASGPAVGLMFTADLEGEITVGVTQMEMTDIQQVTLTIQPIDKKGNPALVDGIPVWLSSNEAMVTVTPAPDGLSAVAAAVGPIGTGTTVSVKVDADLGAGVTEISGSLPIDITGSGAASVTIVAGAPVDQPTT